MMFGGLAKGTKFVLLREAENGNACIYLKITPRYMDRKLGHRETDRDRMIRNAARCFENESEFVTFCDYDKVAIIVE